VVLALSYSDSNCIVRTKVFIRDYVSAKGMHIFKTVSKIARSSFHADVVVIITSVSLEYWAIVKYTREIHHSVM